MDAKVFLLLDLAIAFYNAGTIWAHEIDIFRSWKLLDPLTFHAVQRVPWRKLRYWVLTPVGFSLLGSIVLIWYHPSASPLWGIAGAVLCQGLSIVLTAGYWGRWQGAARTRSGGSGPPLPCKDIEYALGADASRQLQCLILLFWALMVL